MLTLARALRTEEPRIDAVLQAQIAELPPLVRPVAAHTLNAGGKRLRPLLCVFMGKLFGCDHPDIYTLAVAVEFFHVATLMHDDLLDNAATRRGKPSAHTEFSPTEAVLGGDAMLAHAAKMVAGLDNTRLSRCFAEAVLQTATGEIAEFASQGDIDLSRETYLAIITGKTAWSLRAACELAAIRSGGSDDEIASAALFGLELGVAFQIVDDALDIAPSKTIGKPAGGDLRERKCTPLIRFYRETLSPEEDASFASKFKAGSFTDAEAEAIIKAMRKAGCDEKTRALAAEHLARATKALSALPAGAIRDTLALVSDYIRTRGH